MDPDRWRRVDQAFQDCLDLEGEARERFLARLGDDDPALEKEVRELLRLDRSSGEFLEVPASEREPKEIGKYRIVRRIATGGMGVVFEAEQSEPKRRVALKLLRGGPLADAFQLRLFRREVESLSRMQDPTIATIHDAGHTDDGLPYFVMELVPGVPLDEWVRRERPDDVKRLSLFVEICGGVDHAHTRGVMHRDLKPANILVDDQGRPKILDFGVARVADSDVAVTTISAVGRPVPGTLPYMSPEQVSGPPADVDFRADVYALGVLLFQLLTDRLPFDFDGRSTAESVRMIGEGAPARLRSVRPDLDVDLETIVGAALEKEPERRYRNVAALREDVRRVLADQPILRRPPTTAYQLRKWFARNRAVATGLVAAMLGLVAFVATLWIANDRLAQETARAHEAETKADAEAAHAREEAARSEQAMTFLVDTLRRATPDASRGKQLTVMSILDVTARRGAAELRDQPSLLAPLAEMLGSCYLALGQYEEAEQHLRTALAALDAAGRAGPRVARAHNRLAAALAEQHRVEEAIDHFQRSVALWRGIGGHDDELSQTLKNLGGVLLDQGRQDEAVPLLEEALALGAEDPELVARVQRRLGDAGRAETSFRRALEMQIERHGEDHTLVATTRAALAMLLCEHGRLDEGVAEWRRCLASRLVRLAPDHPVVIATRVNLGVALAESSRTEDARKELEAVLEHWRSTDAPDWSEFAITLSALAHVNAEEGRLDDAERCLRDAVDTSRRIDPSDPLTVAAHTSSLAGFLQRLGRLDEAEPLYRDAFEVQKRLCGPTSPRTLASLNELGRTLLLQGRADDAIAAWEAALSAFSARTPPSDASLALRSDLALALEQTGRVEDAASHLAIVIETLDGSAPGDPRLLPSLRRLHALYERSGRADEAAGCRARIDALADDAGGGE